MDLWSFFVDNLEAAGVIGGYVSISIIGVALLTFATKGKTKKEGQIGPKWAHPIIGALMGIIPGCGATIVVSSMYKNKKISFGGLFAAFIATLGEGSFVLLGASEEADVAANLTAFVIVNIVGFVVGTLAGYVIDRLKIGADVESIQEESSTEVKSENSIARKFVDGIGFYLMLAMAAFLAPGSIMALWGGGIDAIADLTVWVAIALTLVSAVYYLVDKFVLHESCCNVENKDIKSTLTHAIGEVSMVVTFVFIGLFVANFIIDILVGPETFDAWMTSSTFIVVLLAALIGATPGCGGMIAVAVAYVSIPNFPIAALIAAAIATSGDGIFPLIAKNKKDALLITVSGFAVALVVGYGALLFGF